MTGETRGKMTLPMESMSGGEAMLRGVLANGVDTVFGLPGVQTYPLYDALARQENAVRTVTARHELSAAYMAYGYAKSSGKPGIFSVVPGPGMLNAAGALCTASGANAPVMLLTGQVPSEYLGRGRGHLHELPDQLATMRSFIKWAGRIDSAGAAPAMVDEAFRQMMSGRPGPVALEMCWDVMAREGMVDPDRFKAAEIEPAAAPDPDEVSAAAKILAGAKSPMIMVGGGAQHASAEVLELAEMLGAPVASFRSGRGIVSEAHELGINCVAAHELWGETDALIAIGSRCELQYMRWTGMARLVDRPEAPPHLVRIDIDPAEMQRLKAHAPILADARAGTRALIDALSGKADGGKARRARIGEAKRVAAAKAAGIQPHAGYLAAIREVLPEDGFLVEEICQAGFTSLFAFPVYRPRTFVTGGFQGALGFGFPTALGVKVAHPDRAVISLTGDGGFLFAMSELASAAQQNIAAVTVLFNNGAYGNVRRDQQRLFDGRAIASTLDNPDFVKLAESFGVAAWRAGDPRGLKAALEQALSLGAPALIEVPVDPVTEASPWPLLMPA